MARWGVRLGDKNLFLKILIRSHCRCWKPRVVVRRLGSSRKRNRGNSVLDEGVLQPPEDVVRNGLGNRNVRVAAGAAEHAIFGRSGGLTGSLDINSSTFTMLMNGYKGSEDNPTHLTASFRKSDGLQYFAEKSSFSIEIHGFSIDFGRETF